MKSITFDKLKDLGINPLTGEACAFSMRILCDLSQEGVELMSEYLSVKADAFNENWNSFVGEKPAVASIMLTREAFPLIVRFALFRMGFRYVAGRDSAVGHLGFNDDDVEKNPILSLYLDGTAFEMRGESRLFLYRNPRNPAASSGSRNIHQASGRSE